jgi:hypothetical protein
MGLNPKKINWSKISPKDIMNLTEQMFKAGNVSPKNQVEYYKAFFKYLDSIK